ncbi:MAG: homoserine kinase [Thermotogaceae bacterium]|nr:homoserine kinase [Thermotogaceae bacterium]
MRWAQAMGKATVANVGCGFDVLGFSVDCLYDVVTIKRCSDFQGVKLKVLNNKKVPNDPDKNTAGFAVKEYLKLFQIQGDGLFVELDKRLPLGSGLGSSAASSVAALLAVNAIYDNLATKEELFNIGLRCEQLACGSAHGDNIAPSLYGGVILIRHSNPMKVIPIPIPEELYCLLIHPEVEVNTQDARAVLPKSVPLSLAVKQWSNIGALITGFCLKDKKLIRDSLNDYLIEEERAAFIPHFYEMKDIAYKSNTFNLSISGSGPTVFSFSDSYDKLLNEKEKIEKLLEATGISCQTYLSRLNNKGSYVQSMGE